MKMAFREMLDLLTQIQVNTFCLLQFDLQLHQERQNGAYHNRHIDFKACLFFYFGPININWFISSERPLFIGWGVILCIGTSKTKPQRGCGSISSFPHTRICTN